MIAQNSFTATFCKRAIGRSARRHVVTSVSTLCTALGCYLAWLAFAMAPSIIAQQPLDLHVAHNSQGDDTKVVDAPNKRKPAIIATSDGSVTITFSNCRENEKHHVSCQMADEAGDLHWVYLPGMKLPDSSK